MAIETERKFLVDPAGLPSVDQCTSVINIMQGYLSNDPLRIVRVRLQEMTYSKNLIYPQRAGIVTVKGRKVGPSAKEWEWAIPYEDAEEMFNTLVLPGSTIEKTRYVAPVEGSDGLMYEVDVFKGRHQGIVVAEIELPTPDAHFTRAPWIRREVTEDRRFANSYMASINEVGILDLVNMCQSGDE